MKLRLVAQTIEVDDVVGEAVLGEQDRRDTQEHPPVLEVVYTVKTDLGWSYDLKVPLRWEEAVGDG